MARAELLKSVPLEFKKTGSGGFGGWNFFLKPQCTMMKDNFSKPKAPTK